MLIHCSPSLLPVFSAARKAKAGEGVGGLPASPGEKREALAGASRLSLGGKGCRFKLASQQLRACPCLSQAWGQ